MQALCWRCFYDVRVNDRSHNFTDSSGKGRSALESTYIRRVSEIIEPLQGKWTVQILCAMRIHPVRLSVLKREIPSASKKALTASLRSLEAARVVVRHDLSSSGLHIEYELVESMRVPPVALLDHLSEVGQVLRVEDVAATMRSTPALSNKRRFIPLSSSTR